jgi:arsenate reductase
MQTYVIYHNPKCSKSRATLELLLEKNVNVEIVEYLDNPPTGHQLKRILSLLNYQPIDLIRRGEDVFSALNLDGPTTTEDQLVSAMIANPILIERPIVLCGNRAIIGRPPEQVLDLL